MHAATNLKARRPKQHLQLSFSQAAIRKIASELRHAIGTPPDAQPPRVDKESNKDEQIDRAKA